MFYKFYDAINFKSSSHHKRYLLFLLILILMSMAGLVGSDIYLPALPLVGGHFHKSQSAVQITLSIYLVGSSISQLIYGPIGDRYGRKWPIVSGMTVFLLASLLCALADNFAWLVIGRLFQSLGACSGLTLGRSIVGDCFEAKDSAKVFSTISPFMGMSPAISPVIGGVLTEFFGWRATFFFLAIFAVIILFLVLRFLNETASIDKINTSIRPKRILANYASLLVQLKFWRYTLIQCFAYIAYFSYLAESPFIFHKQNYGAIAIGFSYISLSVTYLLGNIAGKKLLNYLSLNRSIFLGYVIFLLGGFTLFFSAHMYGFSPFWMIFSMSVLLIGSGFLLPQGAAGVVSSFPEKRGIASGLMGFFQLGSAAISSALVNYFSGATVTGLGNYILIVCIISILGFCLTSYPALIKKSRLKL